MGQSSKGNKHQKYREVHKKKRGKVRLNNVSLNATSYSQIPTLPSSVAEAGHSFMLGGNIYSQPGVQAKHKELDVLAPHLTRQTLPNAGAGNKATDASTNTFINTPPSGISCLLDQIQTPAW